MDLMVGITAVSLLAVATLAVGVFAGGCLANWEEARSKNSTQNHENEDRKARAT